MGNELLIEPRSKIELAAVRGLAVERRWRLTLLMRGDEAWCRAAAREMLADERLNISPDSSSGEALWIALPASEIPGAVSPQQAIGVLGREFSDLVFDAQAGFDPNAFGAGLGTVRSGGLVLLLAPLDLSVSVHAGKRFFHRLLDLLHADPGVGLFDQSGRARVPVLGDRVEPTPMAGVEHPSPSVTADQAAAVEAVLRVVHGHRRRPLLLIADRGRGKSAAMGIAAAHLLRRRPARILVTAPSRVACQALFDRVGDLGLENRASDDFGAGPGSLRFVAPDELLRRPQTSDLVLVDEAAAIPLPMLAELLKRHARIVFASTVHGYEGSGRGFCLRFQRLLDEQSPGWHLLRLSEPIRYAADDPVEALGFRALLLDAEPAVVENGVGAALETVEIEALDRDRLAADEPLMRQLFGLLVSAHYQTRPADLAHLLDAEGLGVWTASQDGRVLAAALVADEGGLDAELSRAIACGERRPPGHLLAQTLAAHAGFAEAAQCRFARVLRIAVHPGLRRRGLGDRLLDAIAAEAGGRGLDFIGASFGADAGLMRFWRRCGFATVRVGVRRDAASGAHSAVLLRPLQPGAEVLFETMRRRFHQQLTDWLIEPLGDLDVDMVLALLVEDPAPEAELGELDGEDLLAFAEGHRDFAAALPALRRLARTGLARGAAEMEALEVEALVLRVLQRRAESEVVAVLDLAGRAALVDRLRAACRRLLALSAHGR